MFNKLAFITIIGSILKIVNYYWYLHFSQYLREESDSLGNLIYCFPISLRGVCFDNRHSFGRIKFELLCFWLSEKRNNGSGIFKHILKSNSFSGLSDVQTFPFKYNPAQN